MISCAVPMPFHLGDEFREFRVLRGGRLRQRMIGRDRHELGAEQRVMAAS